MTFTLTPISVKKSDGTATPMIAYNDGTNNAFANAQLDATGAVISPATSGNQTTANSTLSTIATNTTSLATAAAQTTANTSLASIATNTSGVATAAKQDTGNTSLAALVTNTSGVATSAKQDTGNTSLATIATAVTTIATNSGTEATAALQTTGNTSLATIATAVQAATPAGTNLIGSVTSPGTVHLTAAPTVTAGAYAAGTVVGGLITLTGAARINSGSGFIQSVIVTVKTALTQPFDVLFFDTNPTNSTFTDNAALAVNVADLPYLCGIAHCTDLVSLGTPQGLAALNMAIPFKLSAANTNLYAVIVMRGSGQTLASTSAIGLSALILQD